MDPMTIARHTNSQCLSAELQQGFVIVVHHLLFLSTCLSLDLCAGVPQHHACDKRVFHGQGNRRDGHKIP